MDVLIEGEFVLERFPGKGGWTFVRFPKSLISSKNSFGMMQVDVVIDSERYEGKHLMPMGDGFVFFPVSKPIRDKIKKEQGEVVYIRLLRDTMPSGMTDELKACLLDDPGKLELFGQLNQEEQSKWIGYIYSAASEEAKAQRIVKLLEELGQKF